MIPDEEKLEEAIAALKARFGANTLYRLGNHQQHHTSSLLPTGFPSLDEALGGGLPRGRVIEIGGVPTSGVVTLTLKMLASAQMRRTPVLYVDLEKSFDPVYSSRCGVLLDKLTLVHPTDGQQALAIMTDLLGGGWGGLTVLDLGEKLAGLEMALALALDRLLVPLARSGGILFLLHSSPATLHHAAVRLRLEREQWLYHHHDIHGYQALIQVTSRGIAPRRFTLDFILAGMEPL